MNIALFASAFHPSLGGVEELCRQLALELLRQGHAVIVLTNRWPRNLSATQTIDGIPIYRLPFRMPEGSAKAAFNYHLTHRRIERDMLSILRQHHINMLHIECVSSNAHYAMIAQQKLNLPLVVTLQGELTMDANQIFQKSPQAQEILRRSLDSADVITACSAKTLRDAEEFYGQSFGKKGRVIFNGVNLAEFATLPRRHEDTKNDEYTTEVAEDNGGRGDSPRTIHHEDTKIRRTTNSPQRHEDTKNDEVTTEVAEVNRGRGDSPRTIHHEDTKIRRTTNSPQRHEDTKNDEYTTEVAEENGGRGDSPRTIHHEDTKIRRTTNSPQRHEGMLNAKCYMLNASAAPPTHAQCEMSDAKCTANRPFILALGRLAPQKAFDTLIRAYAAIAAAAAKHSASGIEHLEDGKDATKTESAAFQDNLIIDHCSLVIAKEPPVLLIAGDGPERENLQRLINDLGLQEQVKLIGRADHAKVVTLFLNCEFFVLPSRADEGLPVVCAEAMGAGCAIIATRSGGAPEAILHGQNGLLVDKENIDQLIGAIQKFIADPDLVDRMGKAGKQRAAEFAWPKITRQYLDAYTAATKNDEFTTKARRHEGG